MIGREQRKLYQPGKLWPNRIEWMCASLPRHLFDEPEYLGLVVLIALRLQCSASRHWLKLWWGTCDQRVATYRPNNRSSCDVTCSLTSSHAIGHKPWPTPIAYPTDRTVRLGISTTFLILARLFPAHLSSQGATHLLHRLPFHAFLAISTSCAGISLPLFFPISRPAVGACRLVGGTLCGRCAWREVGGGAVGGWLVGGTLWEVGQPCWHREIAS